MGRNFKPSDLVVVSKRDENRRGEYQPSAFLRVNDKNILEQMWWSDKGDAVWERIPVGSKLTLKDIALGKGRR